MGQFDDPEIAVVIPTHNRGEVLPRAVESVLAQKASNFELIVVDDCSADGTIGYLRSVKDPRFRWHRFDERRRANAARNHGVGMSRAPILSFLDSDDYYLPHRLAEAVAFFAEHPEVDVRISSFDSRAGSESVPRVNPEAILGKDELERYLVGHCLYLGGSGITIRRRAFDEIGGFDPTLTRIQDRELLLRAARSRGCASSDKIDWVKIRSADSISRQPRGLVASFAALCRRHPVIREKYPDLSRYLVAREIINPVLNGRVRDGLRAYKEARRDPQTEITFWSLVPDYVRGRDERRKLRGEIFRRFGTRMT